MITHRRLHPYVRTHTVTHTDAHHTQMRAHHYTHTAAEKVAAAAGSPVNPVLFTKDHPS